MFHAWAQVAEKAGVQPLQQTRTDTPSVSDFHKVVPMCSLCVSPRRSGRAGLRDGARAARHAREARGVQPARAVPAGGAHVRGHEPVARAGQKFCAALFCDQKLRTKLQKTRVLQERAFANRSAVIRMSLHAPEPCDIREPGTAF